MHIRSLTEQKFRHSPTVLGLPDTSGYIAASLESAPGSVQHWAALT
jgi:hypothetical protein